MRTLRDTACDRSTWPEPVPPRDLFADTLVVARMYSEWVSDPAKRKGLARCLDVIERMYREATRVQ